MQPSYLRSFNVVVEVVTEGLDVRYNLVPTLFRKMPGEKNFDS